VGAFIIYVKEVIGCVCGKFAMGTGRTNKRARNI